MRIRKVSLLCALLISFAIGCSFDRKPAVDDTKTPTAYSATIEIPSPTEQPSSTPLTKNVSLQQKIAYLNVKTPWIYDPTTGDSMSFPNYSLVSFDWLPDGHWIIFTALLLDNETSLPKARLFEMNVETGQIIQITNNNQISEFALSPDGYKIVYPGGNEYNDLYTMSIDQTSLISRITYTTGFEANPAWSPDGLMIAYLYGEIYGDYNELRILDLESKNTYTLIKSDTDLGQFDWSPDGEKIAFTYGRYECSNVYEVILSDLSIKQLTDLPGCTYSPNWSLDGEWLVFNVSNLTTGNWWDREWNIFSLYDGVVSPMITGINSWPSYPKIAPVPFLEVGRTYVVTGVGQGSRLFDAPTVSGKVISQLGEDSVFVVLDGPVDADNFYWWHIKTNDMEGWVRDVAGWYSSKD
jgi:dipeptidyl aminopeptidase/acylaminoacyl peptidase